MANVNADHNIWQRIWKEQTKLGIIPYYMFVERDTGAKRYFEVPLYHAYEIFKNAYANVSGMAKTVRGPSMSTTYGKVEISGISEINGQKVFVLRFIQARDSKLIQQPFFAKFDPKAKLLSDLKPAFAENFPFHQENNQNIIIFDKISA